jgi:acetolactate synthase-1/2/3 large subunit
MHYTRITDHGHMDGCIAEFLARPGAGICELNVSRHQPRSPKVSAFRRGDGVLESRPLEDMAPFLPREEVFENMHLFDEGSC